MKFHQKIALLRKLYNHTQKHLGKCLHITASAYGKLERGETSPDALRVQQLANVYHLKPDELTNEALLPVVTYQNGKWQVSFSAATPEHLNHLILTELNDMESVLARLKSKLK